MSSNITSPNEDVILHCPYCGEEKFKLVPMKGKNGERFVSIHCHKCAEHLFFQTTEPREKFNSLEDKPVTWKTEQIMDLQQEWEDWLLWRKRHIEKSTSKQTAKSKYAQWLLGLILSGITMFFVLDRWHLLAPFLENNVARQKQILEYTERLLEVPCLPTIMKVKIRTVPIRYTRELPVHQKMVQYGEAGIYWGEEQIKIHRSNFWFFGWPKNTQLLNTLVHELRHRSNPWLGHNSKFIELVKRDMRCVLKHWPS